MKRGTNVAAVLAFASLLALGTAFGQGRPAATAPVGPPLYYQDPDGKPDYSPTPKKTPDGRDFVPVIRDPSAADLDRVFAGDESAVIFYGHHHPRSDVQGRALGIVAVGVFCCWKRSN